MKFDIFQEFGEFCANGERAAEFRFTKIEPDLLSEAAVVLDFEHVRNMNSSFSNALIANLISGHPEVLSKLRFVNCCENVKAMVTASIELGMKMAEEKRRQPA